MQTWCLITENFRQKLQVNVWESLPYRILVGPPHHQAGTPGSWWWPVRMNALISVCVCVNSSSCPELLSSGFPRESLWERRACVRLLFQLTWMPGIIIPPQQSEINLSTPTPPQLSADRNSENEERGAKRVCDCGSNFSTLSCCSW